MHVITQQKKIIKPSHPSFFLVPLQHDVLRMFIFFAMHTQNDPSKFNLNKTNALIDGSSN
jgi:hypothetical protein